MDKQLLDKYKKRISSSNPLELTNISFELFEHYAVEATKCDRDSEDFQKNSHKALDFMVMMDNTLDQNFEISHTLSEVYQYVIKLLNDAIEHKEPIFINDALRVLKPLSRAFKDIEKDGYGEINKNTFDKDVFAGLTYGKNGLNEYLDDRTGGKNFEG